MMMMLCSYKSKKAAIEDKNGKILGISKSIDIPSIETDFKISCLAWLSKNKKQIGYDETVSDSNITISVGFSLINESMMLKTRIYEAEMIVENIEQKKRYKFKKYYKGEEVKEI